MIKKVTYLFIISLAISCSTKTEESKAVKVPEVKPSHNQAPEGKIPLWEVEKLPHPESVALSPTKDYLFVSSMGNNKGEENPDGFLSKISLTGEVLDLKWVDGIRAPKGICILNDRLFVSAVTELLEISIESGEILKRHSSKDVIFLNDVTSDSKGNIYVSGMFENAIYKLDTDGNFTQIYINNDLNHPNGIFVSNNTIYIGTWGRVDNTKIDEDSTGHFYSLDMETNQLSQITSKKLGKIDGIQKYGNDLLISLWDAGEILKINLNGETKLIHKTEKSVGDFLYLEDSRQLFLPMNLQTRLEAHQLP